MGWRERGERRIRIKEDKSEKVEEVEYEEWEEEMRGGGGRGNKFFIYVKKVYDVY